MTPAADFTRRVAHVTSGAATLLLVVQAIVDDLEGAATRRQWGLIGLEARHAVLACLSVRCIRSGGEPFAYEDQTSFDPFLTVDQESVAEAEALVVRAAAIENEFEARQLIDEVVRFAMATEQQLELASPLPDLRSPEGMFGAIGFVRVWQPFVEEFGLPSMLPAEWTAKI